MAQSAAAPAPFLAQGLARWHELAAALPGLLDALWNAPSHARLDHPVIPPAPGLYLFVEDGQPMYVGQTRNLRQRLAAHCRPGSRENQASFAFNLTREAAFAAGLAVVGYRKVVAVEPAFAALFVAAKERVAAMDMRFIELADPELRTVFEVYGTLALGTERYNVFETH